MATNNATSTKLHVPTITRNANGSPNEQTIPSIKQKTWTILWWRTTRIIQTTNGSIIRRKRKTK